MKNNFLSTISSPPGDPPGSGAKRLHSISKPALAVIGLFLLLYILPLGVRPMIIPDETRYAEVPREMLNSGDWVVPHLDGFRYFEKPVLGYWLGAASIRLFGENAFAARLPSALAVGLSALLIYLLLKNFGGGRREALLAAAVFFTCPMIFAVGTFNVLDSVFSLLVTASLASFFFAYQAAKRGKKQAFLLLSGASCGLAFLSKGFIALAIPVTVILPFLLWERRGREILKYLWLPLLAALLIASPWSILIHLREADFWQYFFWVEHIQRFMGSDPQHPQPFWFFLPVLLGGLFPCLLLLPAAIGGIRKIGLRSPLLRFALCWFFFPFLFFSLSRGKLGTYILPCFPPLIIMIVIGVASYLGAGRKRAFAAGAYLLAALLTLLGAGLILSRLTGWFTFKVYGVAENWRWISGSGALFFWAFLVIGSIGAKKLRPKLGLFAAGPVLFLFLSAYIIPDQFLVKKAPGEPLRSWSARIRPDTILISDSYCAPAICWFYRRADLFILRKAGELKYGLSYPDSRSRGLTFARFRKLVKNNSGRKEIILILDNERFADFEPMLPRPRAITRERGFVLARY